MKTEKIQDNYGHSHYYMFGGDNFEYKNPLEILCQQFITPRIAIDCDLLHYHKKLTINSHNIVLKRNLKEWFKHLKDISTHPLEKNYFSILGNPPKKDQIKLLRGLTITAEDIWSLYFNGAKYFGFTWSRYRFEHQNKSHLDLKHPEIIHFENNKLTTVGTTDMTDGQLKVAVNFRHVVVANFLDNENGWLCFFATYAGIKGQERHIENKPHFHFISDKWGLTREYVLGQLASDKYSLPSLPHIELLNYRT